MRLGARNLAMPAGAYSQPPPAPSGGMDPMMLALLQIILGEQTSKRQESLDERLLELRERESEAGITGAKEETGLMRQLLFENQARGAEETDRAVVASQNEKALADLDDRMNKDVQAGVDRAYRFSKKVDRLRRPTVDEDTVIGFLQGIGPEIRTAIEKAESPLELSVYLDVVQGKLRELGESHADNLDVMEEYDRMDILFSDLYRDYGGRIGTIVSDVKREAGEALAAQSKNHWMGTRELYENLRGDVAVGRTSPATARDEYRRSTRRMLKSYVTPSGDQLYTDWGPTFEEGRPELPVLGAARPEIPGEKVRRRVQREFERAGRTVERRQEALGETEAEIGAELVYGSPLAALGGAAKAVGQKIGTYTPAIGPAIDEHLRRELGLGSTSRVSLLTPLFGQREEPEVIDLVSEQDISEEERRQRELLDMLFGNPPLAEMLTPALPMAPYGS